MDPRDLVVAGDGQVGALQAPDRELAFTGELDERGRPFDAGTLQERCAGPLELQAALQFLGAESVRAHFSNLDSRRSFITLPPVCSSGQ